ncbi:MAG TPA: hypothetical protein VIL37_15675 [Natronosporangium sp.]
MGVLEGTAVDEFGYTAGCTPLPAHVCITETVVRGEARGTSVQGVAADLADPDAGCGH